jgi:hypothetical protein
MFSDVPTPREGGLGQRREGDAVRNMMKRERLHHVGDVCGG